MKLHTQMVYVQTGSMLVINICRFWNLQFSFGEPFEVLFSDHLLLCNGDLWTIFPALKWQMEPYFGNRLLGTMFLTSLASTQSWFPHSSSLNTNWCGTLLSSMLLSALKRSESIATPWHVKRSKKDSSSIQR